MKKKKTKRDPGPAIREMLRQEVNFGCPIRNEDGTGCGSPVLTYHHFNPPWKDHFEHNPDGMIALCPEHHHLADGGHFSNKQLETYKRSPYIDDILKVPWPFSSETLVVKVGRKIPKLPTKTPNGNSRL